MDFETTGRREVAGSVLTAVLTSLCAGLIDWAIAEARDYSEHRQKEQRRAMKKKKPKPGMK